jgi:hypothetical protein
MRLINADEHECWACTHHATGTCDTWCDAGEAFEQREDVKNAKTAYDIEAVVVLLEDSKQDISNNTTLGDCFKVGYRKAINEAIEIVRKGGVK